MPIETFIASELTFFLGETPKISVLYCPCILAHRQYCERAKKRRVHLLLGNAGFSAQRLASGLESAQELRRLTLASVCVAARVGPRNRVRVKCFYRWCENVLPFLTQYKMMAFKIKTDAEAN